MSSIARSPAPGRHLARPAFLRLLDAPAGAPPPQFTCANCGVRKSCLAGAAPAADLRRAEGIVQLRRKVGRGEPVFRAGDRFKSLYAIRNGFFKTVAADSAGREQVSGFFMRGELLGVDGLAGGRHESGAIA